MCVMCITKSLLCYYPAIFQKSLTGTDRISQSWPGEAPLRLLCVVCLSYSMCLCVLSGDRWDLPCAALRELHPSPPASSRGSPGVEGYLLYGHGVLWWEDCSHSEEEAARDGSVRPPHWLCPRSFAHVAHKSALKELIRRMQPAGRWMHRLAADSALKNTKCVPSTNMSNQCSYCCVNVFLHF